MELEGEDVEEEAVEVVGLAVGLVEVLDFDGVVDLKGVKELSKVYIYIYIYIYILYNYKGCEKVSEKKWKRWW